MIVTAELDYAITPGIIDIIPEYGRATFALLHRTQQ
jgi:hypothetical protein